MAEEAKTEETNAQRYERGEARLLEVDGREGKRDVDALGDLGRYIYEFGYGDIYSREGRSLRDRELAAVAMLTVLGGREEQLSLHIGSAMRVGLTPEEIREVIIHTVVYAGFPTAMKAMQILHQQTSE